MTTDPEHLQTVAARDQLWASLRTLLPEIDKLAQGRWNASDHEKQIVQLLARIVAAELRFRAGNVD